ncbi:MAG: MarR family winged helix-turn-helix transcriptional regulator [Pseudomonadota bacterium]
MAAQFSSDGSAPSVLHLLHRAGQCADELFTTIGGADQLTPRQYEVLRTVAVSDDPSQTYLVSRTGIDRSTLADIVRRLVERGLLQRSRTRNDARRYAVSLTDGGRMALQKAGPAVEATNQRLLSALAELNQQDFVVALSRIIETVETGGRDDKQRT